MLRGKMLHQKRGSYKYILPLKNLTGQPLGKKKMSQPQKCTFWEEVPNEFALKIEISWAKKDVKPGLETWNVNDVIVYVWYIYSQIKKN